MGNQLKTVVSVLQKLFFILTPRQKRLSLVLVFITLINAVLQTVGVAILVPIVNMMIDSSQVMEKGWAKLLCSVFNITDTRTLFVVVCLAIIALYIFKEFFSIFQSWFSAKLGSKIEKETSVRLFKSALHRDYDFFLNYGTSNVIRDVYNDVMGIVPIVTGLTTIATESLTVLLISIYIFLNDWIMAVCIVLLAILCMAVIYRFSKKKMLESGEIRRTCQAETNKYIIQAIEGIKEVQVMQKRDYFLKKYDAAYTKLQKPAVTSTVAASAPTYIVEGVFVVGIMSYICIVMLVDPSYAAKLPILASFMVGVIRMLPSIGRITTSLNNVTGNTPALIAIYNNVSVLKDSGEKKDKVTADKVEISAFQNELSLKNIDWHYTDSDKLILSGLDLNVKRGSSVGIIGQSGAGKSTLADIILGLHIPQKGSVTVDGIDIQSSPYSYSNIIGYVSQSIYLLDASVRENIAFGVDSKDIDDKLIWESLKKAKLDDFVKSLDNGLDTIVGERGVKFSGGQRQRLAIARAMYRSPQILILDEATSALDNETEADVMDAIENLYGTLTMIIIAHRLTTLKKCDEIYKIEDGKALLMNKQEVFA